MCAVVGGREASAARRAGATLLVGATCLASVALFFRETLASGGRLLTGNVGDMRLYVVVLEHWLAALRGAVPFRSPIFFWPEPGALGYSDCVALFVPPYAVARGLGLDPFLAMQATLVSLKVVGFVGMYLLLRRVARVSRSVSALGATLFTIASGSYRAAGHAQLLAVAWVPIVWLLAWRGTRARPSTTSLVVAAALSACLCFTSFYVGWFTLVVSAAIATIAGAHAALADGPAATWQRVRSRGGALGAAALVFVLALVPFVAVYAPAFRTVGGRDLAEVLAYVPAPWQLADVGPGSLVWGRLLHPHFARDADSELFRGIPPLLLAVATIGVLVAARRRAGAHDRLVVAAGIAALATWAVVSRYGTVVPWRAVWALVPGGSAIRVPGRVAHVLNVVVIAAAMVALDAAWRSRSRPWGAVAAGVFAMALLVEQVNVAPPIATLDHPAERAKLARVPAPSPGCRAFYALHAPTREPQAAIAAQLDAMLVAYAYGIPTLNGYSGQTPPGWDLAVFDEGAPARARAWATARGVSDGLCALDPATGTWSADAAVR